MASSFLKSGKDRIGSSYKKTVYKEYSDGTYTVEVAKPAWLGFLGPLLQAEVGDVMRIHLKNFASRPYTIHPHGVFYEKDSEGKAAYLSSLPFLQSITFPLLPPEIEDFRTRITLLSIFLVF